MSEADFDNDRWGLAPSIIALVAVCILCIVCAVVQVACYSRWLQEGLHRFREPLVEGESVHNWAPPDRELQATADGGVVERTVEQTVNL